MSVVMDCWEAQLWGSVDLGRPCFLSSLPRGSRSHEVLLLCPVVLYVSPWTQGSRHRCDLINRKRLGCCPAGWVAASRRAGLATAVDTGRVPIAWSLGWAARRRCLPQGYCAGQSQDPAAAGQVEGAPPSRDLDLCSPQTLRVLGPSETANAWSESWLAHRLCGPAVHTGPSPISEDHPPPTSFSSTRHLQLPHQLQVQNVRRLPFLTLFFFLTMLGLCCCSGFSLRRLHLLQSTGPRAHGLRSCDSQALEHRLNGCGAPA